MKGSVTMADVKKLNMDLLKSRMTKNSTLKEALKDVTPFVWDKKSINEKSVVIDRK